MDNHAEVFSRLRQHDEQITSRLDCIWKLATTGNAGNKTREAIKNHLRHIAILRKAQKVALAELKCQT